MIDKLKEFTNNALRSWFTTGAGAIFGGPTLWAGVQGFFDGDPLTEPDWMMALKGAFILILGMMTRDWTKEAEKK